MMLLTLIRPEFQTHFFSVFKVLIPCINAQTPNKHMNFLLKNHYFCSEGGKLDTSKSPKKTLTSNTAQTSKTIFYIATGLVFFKRSQSEVFHLKRKNCSAFYLLLASVQNVYSPKKISKDANNVEFHRFL